MNGFHFAKAFKLPVKKSLDGGEITVNSNFIPRGGGILLCLLLCLILTGIPGDSAPFSTISRSLLAQGTDMETELVTLKGSSPGPSLVVVGGLHGDETAGWEAADRLKHTAQIKAGTLYILSPANVYGAKHDVRYTAENWDLNRLFPGNPQGDPSEQLAAELWALIEREQPVLVVDLHEALPEQKNWDYLGSSIIVTKMDGIEDLVDAILSDTAAGTLCSEPYNFYGPGMPGSINRTVSEKLDLSTLTIETFRGYPLERRVGDHLALIHFILNWYGMEEKEGP
jgi:predicted deacylase